MLFKKGRRSRAAISRLALTLAAAALAVVGIARAGYANPSDAAAGGASTSLPPADAPACCDAPGVTLEPSTQSAAPVRWTVSLFAPYCGGYQIGGLVRIRPLPPLALPDELPAEGVLFADGAAQVARDADALLVSPSPERAWAQYCSVGDVPLSVVFLPEAGFRNPDEPGEYGVEVSTGAAPDPVILPAVITPEAESPPTGISGTVLLGPTCPVVSFDTLGRCADRPFQATVRVLSPDGATEITRFTSGEDGTFQVPLAPGSYLLDPVPGVNGLPVGHPILVQVQEGQLTPVQVDYDSGIR